MVGEFLLNSKFSIANYFPISLLPPGRWGKKLVSMEHFYRQLTKMEVELLISQNSYLCLINYLDGQAVLRLHAMLNASYTVMYICI